MSLDLKLKKIREKLYVQNEYGYEYQNLDARLSPDEKKYLNARFGINVDAHNMCTNCQARQLIKYHGKAVDDRPDDKFNVRCKYVAGKLPPGSRAFLEQLVTEKGMDQKKALKYLKSTVDPVAWAEMMFGFDDDTKGSEDGEWYLRPYQKEQLRCSALRMVIREGRRSGKTFSIALKLIWYAFNHMIPQGHDANGDPIIRGPKIMIITPYQAQVSNIFDEMEKLLKRNSDLSSKVVTGTAGSLYVKTPFFRMALENGAEISGFVSGVGTKIDGSGGGTMRGQNAHIMYLDEMDMIPDEILDKVVQPILLTSKNTIMIATSTPIGKRGRFYNWCLERTDFKEDYFPSTVLGDKWEAIKHEVEGTSTKDGFSAEYMAEFIQGAHGVFKPTYVQDARADYTYEDTENPNWWHKQAKVLETTELIKVLGIDWNKNAGTEFVVVAYSPSRRHYYVCESTNLSASEFSSVRWKEEVIRLNFKWKPDFIYADEGYGHHIIEDLRIIANTVANKNRKTKMDLETQLLSERLVAYNFSSTVELTSPVDGRQIKKTSKDYLVENSVRVFEDRGIWFPEGDDVIRKQLLNYVVLRRSNTTGKPVYGPENHSIGDHRLDALMLALAGLSLEFGAYSANSMPVSIPGQYSKHQLDKKAAAGEEQHTFDKLRESPVSGILHMLNINRGSTTENEGSHRGFKGPQRSRSTVGKTNESVFEEMWNRAYEPQAQGQAPEGAFHTRGNTPKVVPRRLRKGRRKLTRRKKR